jgi:hypothetical protein
LGVFDKYTYTGSHIPDMVFFSKNPVFSYNEIHEEHKGFLEYVKDKYPKKVNLPLSMMCHSYKYGTDKFNHDIESWLLNHDEKLKHKIAKRISEISKIDFETAKGGRFHNYLWCGLDLYLMKNNTERIIDKLIYVQKELDLKEISNLLAEYYKKNPFEVEKNLTEYFKLDEESFKTLEGYTKTFGSYLSKLTEKDDLDVEKGQELLKFIFEVFYDEWEKILDDVEQKVSKEMEQFLK